MGLNISLVMHLDQKLDRTRKGIMTGRHVGEGLGFLAVGHDLVKLLCQRFPRVFDPAKSAIRHCGLPGGLAKCLIAHAKECFLAASSTSQILRFQVEKRL